MYIIIRKMPLQTLLEPFTREWKWVSFTVTTQTCTPAISAQMATLFHPNTLSSTVSNGMSARVPSEKTCQMSSIGSSISFLRKVP